MAGKRPYKTWPLAELEELEQTRLAVGQRIPAALKEALAAARLVDAGMPVDEVAALEENGKVVEGAAELAAAEADEAKEARFTEALLGVMSGAVSVDDAVADLTGEPTPAEQAARRKEFGQRVNKLIGGGFTVDQAVEALAAEMPVEAAGYRAGLVGADPAQPPERRPEDVDQKTGELLVDRPEPGTVTTEQMDEMVADLEANRQDKTPDQLEPPYARVSAEPRPVTYYWASVRIVTPQPDGSDTIETVSCQCPYGHEREDLAVKHAKKLAAERGLNVVA